MRTALLTIAALIAFAANSLLCRAALGVGAIDAATFTAVRLGAGALVLAALVRGRRAAARGWVAPVALFAYAATFSFAYLRLTTGTGALILFGCVQLTMIGWGLRAGERPRATDWLGLALATGGLVALLLPGLAAPDPIGAALMAAAGVAWGVYSLRGKGVVDPLAATARNFLWTLPLVAVLAAVGAPWAHASARGVALAAASGALASGVGYAVWYAALRGLTSTRAAIVQLAVPLLAAAAGVGLLDEAVSPRLAGAGAAILGGIALAIVTRARRPAPAAAPSRSA